MEAPAEIRKTVLLVDDDGDLREVAAVILDELGFAAIEASSAEDAMEVVRGPARIDLLMTDLAMPGIGGMELALLAKRARPDLKILYSSAYVRAAAGSKALGYGPLLEKPWTRTQLRELIERLIGPGGWRR